MFTARTTTTTLRPAADSKRDFVRQEKSASSLSSAASSGL